MLKYCHCDEKCFSFIDLSNLKIHYMCPTQNQIEIEKYEDKEKKKEKERIRKITKLEREGLPVPSKKKKTNKKMPIIKENCGYTFICDYEQHPPSKKVKASPKKKAPSKKAIVTPLSIYLKSLSDEKNNKTSDNENNTNKKKTFVTFKNNDYKLKIKKSSTKDNKKKSWLIKEPDAILNDENYIYFIPKIKGGLNK